MAVVFVLQVTQWLTSAVGPRSPTSGGLCMKPCSHLLPTTSGEVRRKLDILSLSKLLPTTIIYSDCRATWWVIWTPNFVPEVAETVSMYYWPGRTLRPKLQETRKTYFTKTLVHCLSSELEETLASNLLQLLGELHWNVDKLVRPCSVIKSNENGN